MENESANKNPEILSPGGTLEKLKFAVEYGADAVYCSGKKFGLRSNAGNLSDREIAEAVRYCRAKNRKIYVTVNIFPYNRDIEGIRKHIKYLRDTGVDAVIVSDLGVFRLAKKEAPELPVHISVQANNLNYEQVRAWKDMGANRIVLARELSFEEIKEIRDKAPGIEIELFVHGAVCMSLSGRCLLSNYLTGRDANRGECAQSCRWKYALVEEKRPGEYIPVEEDSRGAYIMNARDLNLSRDMGRFIDIGIDSFKIEGRMKSVHYTAVTAAVYKRTAVMHLNGEKPDDDLFNELNNVSHREYTRGFYFNEGLSQQNYKSSEYISEYRYLGHILEEEKGRYLTEVKHTFKLGEEIEMFTPEAKNIRLRAVSILDSENAEQSYVKQNERYRIKFDTKEKIPAYSILRAQGK